MNKSKYKSFMLFYLIVEICLFPMQGGLPFNFSDVFIMVPMYTKVGM